MMFPIINTKLKINATNKVAYPIFSIFSLVNYDFLIIIFVIFNCLLNFSF